MFELGTPLWQIAVRSLVVYLAVLVGLRVFGKRQLGQMTPPDLVVILLIANAVQNAMVGPDASLQGGLMAALVLLVGNFFVSRLRLANPRFERVLEGTPTLLVREGGYVDANLRRQGIDRAEIESARARRRVGRRRARRLPRAGRVDQHRPDGGAGDAQSQARPPTAQAVSGSSPTLRSRGSSARTASAGVRDAGPREDRRRRLRA